MALNFGLLERREEFNLEETKQIVNLFWILFNYLKSKALINSYCIRYNNYSTYMFLSFNQLCSELSHTRY